MTFRKQLFRSNLKFFLFSVLALLIAAGLTLLLFKNAFSRYFETLGYGLLNEHTLSVSSLLSEELDAGKEETGGSTLLPASRDAELQRYEQISERLQPYGFTLLVIRQNELIYGEPDSEGGELLADFDNSGQHPDGVPELYLVLGTTAVGIRDSASDSYYLAVHEEGDSFWKTPLRRSLFLFFGAFLFMALLGISALLFISGLFTRSLLKRVMRPLEALSEGAERIRQGELSEPVSYHGEAEFEALCRTFNEMQESLLLSERRQKQYEEARRDLVTGISHDLRTPLTSVQGYLKGILDGVANTEEKRLFYLRTAYRATLDMNGLLQKLFDFSRMESGQMPLRLIDGDLAELCAAFLAQKEASPAGARAVFSFSQSEELMPDIRMDVEQIRRILENLLENSLKYAGHAPVLIRVRIFRDETSLSLFWSDDGPGVPPEKLPHIFERFYRCDSARSEKGSGIGLYVVKYLTEQHGGAVFAGNGTCASRNVPETLLQSPAFSEALSDALSGLWLCLSFPLRQKPVN